MAMITELNCNIREAVHVKYLDGNLFSQDVYGNAIRVIVMDGDEPATLAGTVSGTAIREDGSTVALTDSRIDENIATVVLPAAAYTVPGVLAITIKISDTNTVTTLAYVVANVYRTSTDTVVDPGTIIPSITSLIEQIAEAVASIPADYSSLWAALAETFNASKSGGYAVGEYVTYDGGLYRFKNAHTGSWSSSDVDAVNLGSGIAKNASDISDLKSAIKDTGNGVEALDITSFPFVYCTISSTNKAQRTSTKFKSAQIPTGAYKTITITANSENPANISFLKTKVPDDISDNANMTSYLATGETGRNIVAAGTIQEFIIPADAKYIFIGYLSNNVLMIPESVDVPTYLFAEPFLTIKPYKMNNAVVYNGRIYVAKEDVTGAWDETKWFETSEAELAKYILWNVVPGIDIGDVINNSTGLWVTTGSYRGTITRIAGTKKLCIKTGENICYYSLLKSGIIKTGESPYYATGITGQLQIPANTEKTIDVPSDAVYVYILSKGSTGTDVLPVRVLAYGEKPKQILSGLNVSVIGDSISAFTGTIPEGNLAYYTKANAGVRAATEMWWYHFSEITGGELLINESWSGSPVTNVRSATHTAMADPSRCQNIHSWDFGTSTDYDLIVTSENIGTLRQSPFRKYERAYQVGDYLKKVNPDVVLIAGGGNDYNQNAGLGTWNGHTTLDTSDISTFREAYANMINRIHSVYPYALIVCLKPWYWRQPVTAKEQAIVNGGDKTYKDYWDAICEIADLMSCPVIDGITIGFNPWNYYPTFCVDSETKPVHPNAMGQKVMGETVADAIEHVCVGYVEWMKNK